MKPLSKLRIVLSLTAIFLAGGVTGAVIAGKIVWRKMAASFSQQRMADRWCGELQSKLNLTPDQMARIRPIVDDTLCQVKSMFTDQLSATISNSNCRIECVLTAEQKLKFKQMIREHEVWMHQRLDEHPNSAPVCKPRS